MTMQDELINLMKHISKISYELAHEENISSESKEMLLELWRDINYIENMEV